MGSNSKYTVKHSFWVFGFCSNFRFFYSVPEAREVSKNLPGARGFLAIQYGPVVSHGDLIHPQHYKFYQ